MIIRLYNPKAEMKERGQVTVAKRPLELNHKTIAFLSNGKPNVDVIQEKLIDQLLNEHEGIKIIRKTKAVVAEPLNETELEEMVDSSDLVINGIGD